MALPNYYNKKVQVIAFKFIIDDKQLLSDVYEKQDDKNTIDLTESLTKIYKKKPKMNTGS